MPVNKEWKLKPARNMYGEKNVPERSEGTEKRDGGCLPSTISLRKSAASSDAFRHRRGLPPKRPDVRRDHEMGCDIFEKDEGDACAKTLDGNGGGSSL